MSIQVAQHTDSERIPHQNVSLFSTTGNKPMLGRVDEGVDTLLVEVECLTVFVLELFDVVNVDHTV